MSRAVEKGTGLERDIVILECLSGCACRTRKQQWESRASQFKNLHL